jgi:hypothetical protein
MADELRGGGDPLRHDQTSSTVTSRFRKASASQAFSIDPDLVARRAYDRYRMRGGEHGRDLQDWFEAERELIAAQFEQE